MRRRIPHLSRVSLAHVLATLALVVSMGGTAYAAAKYTGKNIKDKTVTSADIANGTLQKRDFTTAAFGRLRGDKGLKGPTGDAGLRGLTGPKGSKGNKGPGANVVSTWAWWDSGYVEVAPGNNTGPADWHAYNGADPFGNIDAGNSQWIRTLGPTHQPMLTLSDPGCSSGDTQGVDCRFGENNGGGLVHTEWDSNISALATLTLLYSDDEDGGSTYNTRAECKLMLNHGSGNATYDEMGSVVQVSGTRQRQLQTITLTGSANRDNPDDYLVRVDCEDADHSLNKERWFVVGGSLNVIATQRG